MLISKRFELVLDENSQDQKVSRSRSPHNNKACFDPFRHYFVSSVKNISSYTREPIIVYLFGHERFNLLLDVFGHAYGSRFRNQIGAIEIPTGITRSCGIPHVFPDFGCGISLDTSQLHQISGGRKVFGGGKGSDFLVGAKFLSTVFL